ncbi:MAG TPA: ABC transporter substrate-binding protein [Symbiobacteriaceae bacterium]|nr:ABC transporter substrate-binding protein [Symbiobacteriaceae bacterium]
MNRGWLRGIAIPLLTAAMLVVSACGSKPAGAPAPAADPAAAAAPAPKKAIKVGYVNVMDDAQAMLAKDAGFYEKNGLDVELVLFDSGTDLIKGIVGGQLQAGVLGFTNAASWAAKGADLKVVGGAQMGYHSILVKKGSGIKTVADLKGKKIATQQKGSTADIVLTGVVLPQAGLKKDDLQMVYVSPAVAIQSLAAGQVDAAFIFEPYEQIAGATSEVEAIYEIGKVWPFPCMVVITSGKMLAEDRATVDALLNAQQEAITMLEKQPADAAKLLTKRFIADESLTGPAGQKVASVDVIQKAIESQMFHWEITQEEVKRMQEVVELMVGQGILTESIQVESFLDLTWQKGRPGNGH